MKQNIPELFRYGLAGGACTCINIALFVAMERMGMHYLLANTLSYIVALVINYFLNSRLVFRSAGKTQAETAKEFVRFVAVRLLSLAADNILFYVAVDKLQMNVYAGKIAISVGIIAATFALNKVFVFRRERDKAEECK